MRLDSPSDTIVAVSTAWQAAPLGIVRLSGPRAWKLAQALLAERPTEPVCPGRAHQVRLRLRGFEPVPAVMLIFRKPHSYSGEDLVELHLPGSLPLLRAVCDALIAAGARRAQPGEFTARAYMHGRIAAAQVDAICALIHARGRDAARQAARIARGELPQRLAALRERLLDLLARVEAGIDFVEEEDVRFIDATELRTQLAALRDELETLRRAARGQLHDERPHVALAGLPNAGKSTLFNALLGEQRVIVSPIVGTTRDVIEAELELDGLRLVLQDCAGLGEARDELDAATHRAAEQAADRADLVLWVHEASRPWTHNEMDVLGRIEAQRRLAVISKIDRHAEVAPPPVPFAALVRVSARTGAGLERLRQALMRQLETLAPDPSAGNAADALTPAARALARALRHVEARGADVDAELVAADLHEAVAALDARSGLDAAEEVLSRVFAQFCIGK